MTERKAICVQGLLPFLLLIAAIGATVATGKHLVILREAPFLMVLIVPVVILWLKGLFIVSPNEGKVLTFFGKYTGTVREPGFWFANPFASKSSISLKVSNFQSPQLKVNDAHGNPIEIACVIVWRVVDTAKAFFDVENYQAFINIQCETALRHLASHFPYEPHQAGELSLRGSPEQVGTTMQKELQDRVGAAGIEIMEAQLSHLAYSPEIAQAMLRRQQAAAVIAARQLIVDGAVGMVEVALRKLESDGIVNLDQAQKAVMVNNLMISLVSESHMQPVLATGSVS
ncbi:SPFH domain-containing protein [Luteolibacter ambystomatis]|uniref:SPFH domain-containing protein n=1 Tax=Luteolibacter ambystomatis TaxID=2824561 RepID=A0A975PGD3_9BACT|nr:SPFH domain-containing protein [Luteolibacter ambystomatis]QUE52197.1 SPFH domain-containing protein [Luteolibacter ambystomatis]